MKLLVLVFISVLLSIPGFSQENDKAPFGGRFIDEKAIVVYNRSDGSQLTQYERNGDWYLTKESTDRNKLPIYKFIKKQNQFIVKYVALNGREYSIFDGENWFKDNRQIANIAAERKLNCPITILKFPELPSKAKFLLEFRLQNDCTVSLVISNILGYTVFESKDNFTRGINKFEFDITRWVSGVYVFLMSANNGDLPLQGMFVKL